MNLENICYGCFREKPEGAVACPHCGFDPGEEQPFLALPMGTFLNGRYMVGKVLGVGGFGITYLGYDLTLEIKVAIKEYMPSGLATRHSDRYSVALTGRYQEEYQNGMNRFLDEARILAKLQNTPNVVSVQNYFKENDTAYFVMEYIDGMSLKEYVASQGGRIPFDQAVSILMPVMQALTKVHAMDLTHRDISPDNISITSGGESKLLDFGAARFSVGDEKSVSVILKHGYAPEEQYSSRGNQGPWTDVYAMGATLYRCVTGELPPDSIMRVHNDTLKKPSELGVSLPSNAERAIMKALSVKVENRFPTMEAFIDGLSGNKAAPTPFRRRTVAGPSRQTGSTGQAGQAVQTGPNDPVGYTVAASGNDPGSPAGARKKSIIPRVAVIVLAVLLIAGGIWKIATGIGGKKDPQESSTTEVAKQNPTITDVTTQEPKGMDDVELWDYTSPYLNAIIRVPEGYKKIEDKYGDAFKSSDGKSLLQSRFNVNDAFPVYGLSDVEKQTREYVDYDVSFHDNVADYEIISSGYRKVGEQNAYRILYSETRHSGKVKEYMIAFIESQNGYGCYTVTGSYPQGDEKAQAEIFAAIESFQSEGPAETSWKIFSDAGVPFRFLYWDYDDVITCEAVSENRVNVLIKRETGGGALDVQGAPVSSQINKENWMDSFEGKMVEKSGYERLNNGERREVERRGVNWIVSRYKYASEKGESYIDVFCGEVDGYVFMILGAANTEEALDDEETLADVTKSIRPVK